MCFTPVDSDLTPYQPNLMFVGKARRLPLSGKTQRHFIKVGSGVSRKHQTRLERLARSKYSNYNQECLPLASLFSLLQCLWVRQEGYPRVEKLKGASLRQTLALVANITLGLILRQCVCPLSKVCGVRLGGFPRVGKLTGASLGQTLAFFTNIGLSWKGLPGTNTLAFYEQL